MTAKDNLTCLIQTSCSLRMLTCKQCKNKACMISGADFEDKRKNFFHPLAHVFGIRVLHEVHHGNKNCPRGKPNPGFCFWAEEDESVAWGNYNNEMEELKTHGDFYLTFATQVRTFPGETKFGKESSPALEHFIEGIDLNIPNSCPFWKLERQSNSEFDCSGPSQATFKNVHQWPDLIAIRVVGQIKYPLVSSPS